MRDRIDDIRAVGAELAVVGNGNRDFAAAFAEDFNLHIPVLVDPELRAYRAAGLRRGSAAVLSPRLAGNALRAMRSGARQTEVQGDAWQLGGVVVIAPGGDLLYKQVSREAGDHASIDDIIDALRRPVPIDESPESGSALERLAGKALGYIVDPLVAPSFDRNGFRIHSLRFDPDDLAVDLSEKRCVVTGANSGIGYESALGLADLGAEVILLCRSSERGEAAAERIRNQTGNRRVRVELVDMSDLASVEQVAERLGDDPVDVLIHNAGVLPDERIESKDGLELTFAVHVAGPWLLTQLLRERLEEAEQGRVIWVSSGGMYTRGLNVEDPQWTERDEYDGVAAYAETKRAQVVMAELWAEEFEDTDVTVNSMHPGWADTPSVETSLPRFHSLTKKFLRTPAEGADTVVWLAASEAASEESGEFFFDREARSTHWLPGTRESEEDREALWDLCVSAADGLLDD